MLSPHCLEIFAPLLLSPPPTQWDSHFSLLAKNSHLLKHSILLGSPFNSKLIQYNCNHQLHSSSCLLPAISTLKLGFLSLHHVGSIASQNLAFRESWMLWMGSSRSESRQVFLDSGTGTGNCDYVNERSHPSQHTKPLTFMKEPTRAWHMAFRRRQWEKLL